MADERNGLTLVPALDEPANSGRYIPMPGGRIDAGSNAALLARPGLPGMSHKGMGGISAGPLPDLLHLLGPAIISGGTAAAITWLQGRAGRKVRLKVGDTEAEARTPAELTEVLKLAREMLKKPTKGGDS